MPAPDVTVVRSGRALVGWAAGADARSAVLDRLLEAAGAGGDTVEHSCPHCGSTEHGPLRTSSGTVVVSLSHAGDLTAGAVARASAAASVGVDVEPDRGEGRLNELAPLFAPAEPPTLREWTLIEAAAKADGRGLRIPPSLIVLDGATAYVPGRAPIDIAAVEGPEGYLISVAIDPSRSSHRGPGSVR